MAMKRYSTFPKVPDWSLIIRCSLVSYSEHLLEKVLPFGRNLVSLFYSPSISSVQPIIDDVINEGYLRLSKVINVKDIIISALAITSTKLANIY